MFEHCEAVPIQLGGGAIAHSLIWPAQLAPYGTGRTTVSVTLGAFLDRLVRPTRERTWRSTRVGAVGWPVFEYREAAPTPLGGGTIAHSLISAPQPTS